MSERAYQDGARMAAEQIRLGLAPADPAPEPLPPSGLTPVGGADVEMDVESAVRTAVESVEKAGPAAPAVVEVPEALLVAVPPLRERDEQDGDTLTATGFTLEPVDAGELEPRAKRAEVPAPEPEEVAELEPEPEPDAESEPEPESESELHAEIEGEMEGEHAPASEAPDDTGPELEDEPEADGDPEAVVQRTRRRPLDLPGARSVKALGGSPPQVVIVADTSRLRSFSISGRLLFLTLGSVTLAAAVVLTSIWGLSEANDFSRQLAGISIARQANSDATGEVRQLSTAAPDQVPEVVARVEQLTRQSSAEAVLWVSSEVVAIAEDATLEYADARFANPEVDDNTARRSALSARADLDDALAAREARTLDRSETLRSRAIALVVVLFLVGSAVLVLLGRIIGRSVAQPLRTLGRGLRRFGDGDMASRAAVAPDEVGTLARSFNAMADEMTSRVWRLNDKAERDSRLRLVSDALDLADREADVYRILEQAFSILTPDNPAELLVSEPSSSQLWQASVNPSSGPASCPVAAAEGCPAMRRAQALTFDGPGVINACPKLREHPAPCSAACVPIGVNGQLLGVIHVTAPENDPPEPEVVEQLIALGGQVGARVGAMRTLESTRLEASTDGLTGLANRRMLEARMSELLRLRTPFSLVVADLDNFKQLNDTYGHEAGDRALQLFAKVLEDNVRGHDLVARYGGEEFVLVYPELSVKQAMEVIERIRVALERAVTSDGVPPFTSSFGVTHSAAADSPDGIVRIADAGLLMAKEQGRNRVVFADNELAEEFFRDPSMRSARSSALGD